MIKDLILTPTTKAELEQAEAKKKELHRQLELNTSNLDNVTMLLPRAVESYRQMVSNLETVTQAEVNKLRTRIGALVDNNIVLRPDVESGHLNAELCGDYAGLMEVIGMKRKLSLVAGDRFKTNFVVLSLDPQQEVYEAKSRKISKIGKIS